MKSFVKLVLMENKWICFRSGSRWCPVTGFWEEAVTGFWEEARESYKISKKC